MQPDSNDSICSNGRFSAMEDTEQWLALEDSRINEMMAAGTYNVQCPSPTFSYGETHFFNNT